MKRSYLRLQAVIAGATVLLLTSPSFASRSAGLAAAEARITTMLGGIVGILTGSVAKGLAFIALCLVAIGMLFAENGVHKLFKWGVGIALLFSGQWIVDGLMRGSGATLGN